VSNSSINSAPIHHPTTIRLDLNDSAFTDFLHDRQKLLRDLPVNKHIKMDNENEEKTMDKMEYFLRLARKGGDLSVIRSFVQTNSINNDFNINYRGLKEYYGWSALHLACYFNHPQLVKYLLDVRRIYYIWRCHMKSVLNCCSFSNRILT
jgi:ankyrin repeat protein